MKRLGQNFLKDARALKRIVSAADVIAGDIVVEIGPGHGELTRRILEAEPEKLIAIEKDAGLIDNYLDELSEGHRELEIVEGDALKILPKLHTTRYLLPTDKYKLIGNIPYYITGHLIRIVGELKKKPEVVVLTLQKEVAERICANAPKTNLLSASVKFWGEPIIVRYISKKSFKPSPKVDSAIIKIVPHKLHKSREEEKQYYKTLHILFSHPRKTILNNLSNSSSLSKENAKELLKELEIDPKLRPQNLTVESINKISLNLSVKKL